MAQFVLFRLPCEKVVPAAAAQDPDIETCFPEHVSLISRIRLYSSHFKTRPWFIHIANFF